MTVNLYVTDDQPRQFPQIPCVFSGKMRLAFNVIVNSYDTRPTAPGFRIFFQLKRASRKPFQIPCVFSMKARRAFKVIVDLYVMRSIAPTFLVFSEENAPRSNPAAFLGFTFLVFSREMRLAFNVIVNSYDTRPTAPGFRIFFQLKRASRKPFQIPYVSSMKVRRAFEVIVNLHVLRLSLPHSLSFPKKMRLAGILPHSLFSLSSAFSGNPVLRSEVVVNLHVMRPAAP